MKKIRENPPETTTGARQTMSSWARVIDTIEEIPPLYQESFQATLGAEAKFPYTVLAPSIVGLRQKSVEKVISAANHIIYIWERSGQQIMLTCFPVEGIAALESGEILLYSWLTLTGVNLQGAASSVTIEFNTATARHFAPFINQIRSSPGSPNEAEQRAEQAKLNDLSTENFKFMNFARESLLPGEKIIQTLYQPKLRKAFLEGFGIDLFADIPLAHLVILTDHALILIQDDERSRDHKGTRYGGKRLFVPLNHIQTIATSSLAANLVALRLTLTPGEHPVEIIFEETRKEKVNELQRELEKFHKTF